MIHLNLSSMADRHLVIAYAIILIAQLGYAAAGPLEPPPQQARMTAPPTLAAKKSNEAAILGRLRCPRSVMLSELSQSAAIPLVWGTQASGERFLSLANLFIHCLSLHFRQSVLPLSGCHSSAFPDYPALLSRVRPISASTANPTAVTVLESGLYSAPGPRDSGRPKSDRSPLSTPSRNEVHTVNTNGDGMFSH